jgi:3-phytase
LAALAVIDLAAGAGPDDVNRLTPAARVQTEPVPSGGDAADDPAVWVHADDPARSLVLGTDKKGGLHAFDLEGRRVQVVSEGSRPDNVDILYDFRLGGRVVDLAVAGSRAADAPGVKIWAIDRATGRLSPLGDGPTFRVFGGGQPYGSCVYRSPRDGRCYVFVNDHGGAFEQYRIDDDDGSLRAERVRAFRLDSQAEGCVADFERGRLYVAEEDVGIWEFGAELGDGDARTAVARVGEHGLTADVEGLTIYYAPGGRGYLIASSQGSDTFNVYDRGPGHAYVATIDPADGPVDDVSDSDGVDVVSQPLGPRFPRGLMVVQDGKARGGGQNFKLFAWDDVAAGRLLIDTSLPARAATGRAKSD